MLIHLQLGWVDGHKENVESRLAENVGKQQFKLLTAAP
jgi:hypothetical protein